MHCFALPATFAPTVNTPTRRFSLRVRLTSSHRRRKAIIEPTNMLRVRATGQATEKRPDVAVDNLDFTTTGAGANCNAKRQQSALAPFSSASASDEAKRKLYAP